MGISGGSTFLVEVKIALIAPGFGGMNEAMVGADGRAVVF